MKNNSLIKASATAAKTGEDISCAGASTEHFVGEDSSPSDSAFSFPFQLFICFNLAFERQEMVETHERPRADQQIAPELFCCRQQDLKSSEVAWWETWLWLGKRGKETLAKLWD